MRDRIAKSKFSLKIKLRKIRTKKNSISTVKRTFNLLGFEDRILHWNFITFFSSEKVEFK